MTADDTAAVRDARFRHLFDDVPDAVVEFEFVDGKPIVRAVNDAFVDLFGYDRDQTLGEPLNDFIVPRQLSAQSARFDERTAAGKTNDAIIDRQTENGAKTLLYRGIPFDDGNRGFAIYTDLTDEIRQERELAALNRVLRHSLREEVDALVEGAETLAAHADDDIAETVASIRERALALDRLSDEARDLRHHLDADPELEPIDLETAVRDALDSVSRADENDVTLDVSGVPSVRADPNLDRPLASLIDNAVRYGESTVEVVAESTAERVLLTVRDDGPGLPPRERRVLSGKLEFTPLDRPSGLGLWLVRWMMNAYEGSVEYEDGDDGGSEITLSFARAA